MSLLLLPEEERSFVDAGGTKVAVVEFDVPAGGRKVAVAVAVAVEFVATALMTLSVG